MKKTITFLLVFVSGIILGYFLRNWMPQPQPTVSDEQNQDAEVKLLVMTDVDSVASGEAMKMFVLPHKPLAKKRTVEGIGPISDIFMSSDHHLGFRFELEEELLQRDSLLFRFVSVLLPEGQTDSLTPNVDLVLEKRHDANGKVYFRKKDNGAEHWW